MKILAMIAVAASVQAAPSLRAPMAAQAFDVAPGGAHPGHASGLAWLERGIASACVASGPEGEALLSAPNFQVIYGMDSRRLTDPFQTDSIIDTLDRNRLRLGTALALSQVGLGNESFDLSLGVAFERDRLRLNSADIDGSRQWIDVSTAVRAGGWHFGAALAEVVVLSEDSGFMGDRRVEIRFGRTLASGLAWGAGLDVPLEEDGEAGFSAAMSRDFRGAILFQGGVSTSYANTVDPSDGVERLVRRSLDLRLGTRLRFRPWIPSEDPGWMRSIVDPNLGIGADGFILRGWEIGVSAGWDLVTGEAKPAIELGRAF